MKTHGMPAIMLLMPKPFNKFQRGTAALSAVALVVAQLALPCSAHAANGRKIYFYHPDHLGSTNLVTDESGQVVQQIEYTPYGKVVTNVTTTSYDAAHKFTGQRADAATGLYFYHARYYNPQLGRFIQPDTIVPSAGDPQALNRYSYVRNNPLKYTDPTGHSWFKKWFEKLWGWFKEKLIPQPGNPHWWIDKFGPQSPVAPGTSQQFNQVINATAMFLVNQWGFSPAAANATIGAVLAIPSGGSSLVAAGLAYGTTELLGTGEARQLIGNLAGFFEQFGVSPEAAATLATQVVSVGVTTAVAITSASARALYNKLVHYDVTWEKGGAAVAKGPGDRPVKGANNVFFATKSPNPNSFCCDEGSFMSRLANLGPGINATSGMHDTFQNHLDSWGGALGVGTTLGWALNVPGMPPAAALTYMSLLQPQEVSFIYGTGSYGAQDN